MQHIATTFRGPCWLGMAQLLLTIEAVRSHGNSDDLVLWAACSLLQEYIKQPHPSGSQLSYIPKMLATKSFSWKRMKPGYFSAHSYQGMGSCRFHAEFSEVVSYIMLGQLLDSSCSPEARTCLVLVSS